MASKMAHTHNCIIRGINSIFLQAPHVHASVDIADLLFFSKVWCDWVAHHHRLEEEHMFPQWEHLIGKPSFMQQNIEQHNAFEPGLNRLHEYATRTDPTNFDAEILRNIINDFATVLQRHLSDEIETLLALQE